MDCNHHYVVKVYFKCNLFFLYIQKFFIYLMLHWGKLISHIQNGYLTCIIVKDKIPSFVSELFNVIMYRTNFMYSDYAFFFIRIFSSAFKVSILFPTKMVFLANLVLLRSTLNCPMSHYEKLFCVDVISVAICDKVSPIVEWIVPVTLCFNPYCFLLPCLKFFKAIVCYGGQTIHPSLKHISL